VRGGAVPDVRQEEALLLILKEEQAAPLSARTEVLAWETGERRREDGGGQDEAPFA